jgi:hypothetical protein
MTTEFLDRALLYIKNESSFSETKTDLEEFTKDENKLLVRAFYKLEKDGYVYSSSSESSGNTSVRFFISFDGLLALENTPKLWKNRPYRYNKFKQSLNTFWTVTKIIAVIINALAILVFTWLTYIKQ